MLFAMKNHTQKIGSCGRGCVEVFRKGGEHDEDDVEELAAGRRLVAGDSTGLAPVMEPGCCLWGDRLPP